MPRIRDITGQRFGRLVVLRMHSKDWPSRRIVWLCQCDCGKTTVIKGNLTGGSRTKSCGCMEGHITHGLSRSRSYRTWDAMIQRCDNPKSRGYEFYGLRGIKVCERWYKFENFFADMGERPMGMSIDRIDNDGNYEPGNCRWATQKEQVLNQRPRRSSRERSVDPS